ncbi:MAG: glycerol-3-phosphate 1-O-acyltransferase PlsY [Ruminococcaceae bacterium]|nr:glycerol-3-phosphate 1-O-acyltransferase PlsY [Oscillospiraceae bacterium]
MNNITWYFVLLILVISYLLGSFQTSYIFGKLFKKVDIRDYGSGNAGTTNSFRVFGAKIGVAVLLIDILKGIVAVLLVKLAFKCDSVALQLLAGLFVTLGHNYPFYMKFKGGKGVAAAIGIFAAVDWRIFLIAGLIGLLILVTTRYMSVASLTFQVLTFIGFVFFYLKDPEFYYILVIAAIYPILSFFQHRKNIKGLKDGTENKLWGKGKKKVKLDEPNQVTKTK